jgi:hypothetical protein
MKYDKSTQKLLAGILSLVLIAGVGSPAFAQTSPNDVIADTTAAANEVISIPDQVSEQCGDVELMFVIDDTGSMGSTLANIAAGSVAIIGTVEASLIPGADAKYGLISFKDNVQVDQPLDTNEALTIAALNALSALGGSGGPEASDMAKQTAIDALPAGITLDQDGAVTTIIGGMTVPYTTADPQVTKIGILITDNVPGGGNDLNSGNDDQHLADLGTQSAGLGIVWYDLIRGATGSDAFYSLDATNSGGTFTNLPSSGMGVADAIIDIITDPDFCVEPEVVGGEFLSIDTTALLVAGAQTNAVWIMSALAVIGSVAFGALYLSTKRN